MFHILLSENWENLSFPLTAGSWSQPATGIMERLENCFSGMIINISHNHESISVHKSLDTIKCSSIFKYFTFDNLFPLVALDLTFKPSNFVSRLVFRFGLVQVSRFFRVFTMIKQCFWYGILCCSHRVWLTRASTTWMKYVQWFYIMPIIFYIIFSPRMNHIKEFLLLWV